MDPVGSRDSDGKACSVPYGLESGSGTVVGEEGVKVFPVTTYATDRRGHGVKPRHHFGRPASLHHRSRRRCNSGFH